MEHIYQPGDPCRDCQQLGLSKRLRYFYINLEDKLLKCESDTCLFPYEDSDDEGQEERGSDRAQVHDSEQPTFAPLPNVVDEGVQLIDELLKETPAPSVDPPVVYVYDFSHMEPLTNEKPKESQVVDSVDSVVNSAPALVVKSEVISEASVKTEPKSSVSDASATSSDDIPKARISRFLESLKSPLLEPKEKPKLKPRPAKKGPKRLKHQLVIEEAPTAASGRAKVPPRPLDLVQQLLARKTKK